MGILILVQCNLFYLVFCYGRGLVICSISEREPIMDTTA